ncbi:hypothetical protein SAMN04489806_0856 [Paramicrobacterium humi]|uniref:Uncharacterized protein n=1 Tax=Paramicrobacterium humi TaxID=640635 RepID=A0A1H4JTK0_9MICO|nr:hypothetical protein [Microbacterium humi]SEB49601.1 hypothetical protein SAMN04489806_0856 [Microbacterium humi]
MADLRTPNGHHMAYLTGNPTELGNEVSRMKNVASTIDKLTEMLGNIHSSSSSQSQKIDELRDAAGEARDALAKARKLYNNTGWALGEYQQQLQTSQTDAKAATDGATAIVGSVTTAENNAASAKNAQTQAVDAPLPTDDGQREAHMRDIERKSNAVTSANSTRDRLQGELHDYKVKWDKAKGDLDTAAETARGRIQGVADNNPAKDSWWDNFAGFLEGLQNILGWIALAITIVALFATGPLALVLFAVATAITAVTLIINATLAVTGKKGWGDAILSAVSLIPFGKFFGKGLTLVTRFKNVGAGFVKNIRFVSKVTNALKARKLYTETLKKVTLSNSGKIRPHHVNVLNSTIERGTNASRARDVWNTMKHGGWLFETRQAAIVQELSPHIRAHAAPINAAQQVIKSEGSVATGVEYAVKRANTIEGKIEQVHGWMTSDPAPTNTDLKERLVDPGYKVDAVATDNPYASTR